MHSNLVSIVIPIYNSEKYVSRCIESLINQTYKNIEIVLVNDGSKDKSKILIEEYLTRDNRIKLYNQENQGPSAARNMGLEKASGNYITFVDADDYIDKQMIETMVNSIKDRNTLVFCNNSEVWSDSIDERKLFQEYKSKIPKEVVVNEIASGKAGLVCGKLFSKYIVERYNIRFDENISMCEDQIFFLNIVKHCDNFRHIQKTLYHYDRRNENSITIKYQKNAINNQIYVLSKLGEILGDCNLNKDDIKSIMDGRFISAISFCINNEVIDTRVSNIKDKLLNIKIILNNDNLNERFKEIKSNSFIDKIIISSFKNKGYRSLYFKFYTLDKIIYPTKRSIKKLIKR